MKSDFLNKAAYSAGTSFYVGGVAVSAFCLIEAAAREVFSPDVAAAISPKANLLFTGCAVFNLIALPILFRSHLAPKP